MLYIRCAWVGILYLFFISNPTKGWLGCAGLTEEETELVIISTMGELTTWRCAGVGSSRDVLQVQSSLKALMQN